MPSKRLLLIDDDKDFVEFAGKFLERAGYEVFGALSSEAADTILADNWIHVILVDVRLVNGDDENDTSGIAFAKRRDYRAIPKIILTRYPSYQYVREAIGPALDGLPPAVDFVAKQDVTSGLIEAVQRAFEQHVHIGPDPQIHFGQTVSLGQILTLLHDSGQWTARSIELEDLFRKMFYEYEQIDIARIVWAKRNKIAVDVFAYSQRREIHLIVTCGSIQAIREEKIRHSAATSLGVAGNLLNIAFEAETLRFGAIGWDAGALAVEETKTFNDVFRQGAEKPIKDSLENLYRGTLAHLYVGGQFTHSRKGCVELSRSLTGFDELSGLNARFAECVDAICESARKRNLVEIERSSGDIHFSFEHRKPINLPDPVQYLFSDHKLPQARVMVSLGVGTLDPETILVDSRGYVALSDFSAIRESSIYHAFASLEANIRFRLMEERNLLALLDFERHLIEGDRLYSGRISKTDLEPDCRLAMVAISKLRELATESEATDLLVYSTALLFFVMQDILALDPGRVLPARQVVSLVHRLLLGAMLCKKIDEVSHSSAATKISQKIAVLRVDEANRNALVGEKEIALTPTEYDLLEYLYKNAGQLCPRPEIAKEVFNAAATDEGMQVSLLNTNISRLREKIEPNPARPIYLITVRGQGYKLIPDPV